MFPYFPAANTCLPEHCILPGIDLRIFAERTVGMQHKRPAAPAISLQNGILKSGPWGLQYCRLSFLPVIDWVMPLIGQTFNSTGARPIGKGSATFRYAFCVERYVSSRRCATLHTRLWGAFAPVLWVFSGGVAWINNDTGLRFEARTTPSQTSWEQAVLRQSARSTVWQRDVRWATVSVSV